MDLWIPKWWIWCRALSKVIWSRISLPKKHLVGGVTERTLACELSKRSQSGVSAEERGEQNPCRSQYSMESAHRLSCPPAWPHSASAATSLHVPHTLDRLDPSFSHQHDSPSLASGLLNSLLLKLYSPFKIHHKDHFLIKSPVIPQIVLIVILPLCVAPVSSSPYSVASNRWWHSCAMADWGWGTLVRTTQDAVLEHSFYITNCSQDLEMDPSIPRPYLRYTRHRVPQFLSMHTSVQRKFSYCVLSVARLILLISTHLLSGDRHWVHSNVAN